MTLTPVRQKSTPKLAHTPFWRVAAPVVLSVLLILAMVVGVVTRLMMNGHGAEAVSIASNFMLICFAICPMLLCSIIFYAVLVMISYGFRKMNHTAQNALTKAELTTRSLADKTQTAANSVNEKTIFISERAAFLEGLLDEPNDDPEKGQSNGKDLDNG